MELEKKKYSCPCGSEVLESNRKAHEKTKKHMNFVGDSAQALAESRKPTKPTRSRKVDYDEDDDDEDEEDYDEAREARSADEDEEDELVVAVDELINTVESLQHKLQLPPPWAVSLTEQLKNVEDRLSKQISDFVFAYNEHRAQDKGGDKAVWINDKSTPKN
jgi:hypothetical protein